MQVWDERPLEIANLLNPAFCGEILCRSIKEYHATAGQDFPYPLAFLVLPIILQSDSRNKIRRRAKEQLHGWIESHQEVRVGFADRARMLVPVTKEAIIYLLQTNTIRINLHGQIFVKRRKQGYGDIEIDAEIKEFYDKATILGRWFARAGPQSTIFSLLGVKP